MRDVRVASKARSRRPAGRDETEHRDVAGAALDEHVEHAHQRAAGREHRVTEHDVGAGQRVGQSVEVDVGLQGRLVPSKPDQADPVVRQDLLDRGLMPSPARRIGTMTYSRSTRTAGAPLVTGVSTVVSHRGVAEGLVGHEPRDLPGQRKKSAFEVATSRNWRTLSATMG
jgi:hypothetical protein